MKKEKVSTWHKNLWKIVSQYIRKRDTVDGWGNCISCGVNTDEFDAGHFIPKTSSAIRYDERNINSQCRKCNRFQSGNLIGYFPAMEKKYGREVVDELMSRKRELKHWTVDELKELMEEYKEKLNKL